MSLTSALRTASSALALNSAQSALVARNIASAGDTNYSRKIGEVVTLPGMGARLDGVARAADPALRATLLAATATTGTSDAQVESLTKLAQSVGDTADNVSPSARLARFGAALESYAATPSDASVGRAAVSAARSLAQGLNDASALVQTVREDADARMGAAVDSINGLLADFDKSNDAVVAGLKAGADVTDAQDARDATLKSLAALVGIGTVSRTDGSLAIYTDGGVTLDDGGARRVSMTRSSTLLAGSTGAAVTVDGVAVTGANAPMPLRAGAIAGLAQIRDTTAPRYGAQLDEIARGLVGTFAEGSPAQPGLFTWSGGTVPAGSSPGLAGSLAITSAVDPDAGGDVTKLRDGTVSGASTLNTAGAAAFSDRLQALVAGLDGSRAFDTAAGLGATGTLTSFANASVGWLSVERQSATDTSAANTALSTGAATALSNRTGVNLDDEMTRMLTLENAYQASAKLLSAANGMFASLFAAIG